MAAAAPTIKTVNIVSYIFKTIKSENVMQLKRITILGKKTLNKLFIVMGGKFKFSAQDNHYFGPHRTF